MIPEPVTERQEASSLQRAGSPTPLKSDARVAEGNGAGGGVGGVPSRPVLRYHGGKWRIAPWIIAHFPAHRTYVEPFGGAGSVLLRKPRAYAEIYNDMDGEIVNLFRVLREHGSELMERLSATPFARVEYQLSFERTDEEMEQARRTVVRSYMGFGSNSLCRSVKSGFRASHNNSGTTAATDWRNFPDTLRAVIERLRGVVIENRGAGAVMLQQDGPQTLFYCDPPYVHSTRTKWAGSGARAGYAHEMNDEQHEALIATLRGLTGKVIVSGYFSALYDRLLGDWTRIDRAVRCDRALERTECLWMNFAPNADLFGPLGGGGRGESVAFATKRKSGNDKLSDSAGNGATEAKL